VTFNHRVAALRKIDPVHHVMPSHMTWMFDATIGPAESYFADFFEAAFFGGGTLPPARRASDSPIATACWRLVTFLPEPPLFNVPALSSFITFSTFSDAVLPYLLAIATLLSFPIRGTI
jgi:hypothetical protein